MSPVRIGSAADSHDDKVGIDNVAGARARLADPEIVSVACVADCDDR